MSSSPSRIKTRLLILSDTHGQIPIDYSNNHLFNYPSDAYDAVLGFREPLPAADVAIHCGDLTLRSTIKEFEDTFSMLRKIRAPLKLVIAGNHDLDMDRQFWERSRESHTDRLKADQQASYVSRPDQVDAVVKAAEEDGVHLLSEGTHSLNLDNGACLKVYASPFTPEYGDWAFQYQKGQHAFDIPAGVDVALTHGPPNEVLDKTTMSEHAGCEALLEALHKARPQVSCFGHIHEGWGAQIASWKEVSTDAMRPYDADDVIDAEKSRFVQRPNHLWGMRLQGGVQGDELARRKKMYQDQSVKVDITQDGDYPLRPGEETLFVNAAVVDVNYRPTNVPWLVDVALAQSSPQ